ncbi:MAG: hypothetical protein LLG00_14545 [Planctomycetaceae bacterium]|nr:hypothetical protein [Planctomycetaceae bacterium]
MSVLASLLAQQRVDADLVQIVVAVIIAIIAGVAKLMSAMRQKQPPPADDPADPPPPPQRPARPVPTDVSDEIDEFLRRAAQRRSARPPATPGDAARSTSPRPPAREASSVSTRSSPAEPIRAEAATLDRPVGGQVTEHVRKYLDDEYFDRRANQLGEDVARADQQVDQHLHQVFDHSVSHLAAVTGESAIAPEASEPLGDAQPSPEALASFTDGVLGVFSDPDSIRQAIVLNEVIRRPEERWQ